MAKERIFVLFLADTVYLCISVDLPIYTKLSFFFFPSFHEKTLLKNWKKRESHFYFSFFLSSSSSSVVVCRLSVVGFDSLRDGEEERKESFFRCCRPFLLRLKFAEKQLGFGSSQHER